MANDQELKAHRDWLGLLQPVGLVVSPIALVRGQAFVNANVLQEQDKLDAVIIEAETLHEGKEWPEIDFIEFAVRILKWDLYLLGGYEDGQKLTDELFVSLTDYEEVLAPNYALLDEEGKGDSKWMMLIQVVANGTDLDAVTQGKSWTASPQARLERLLRETQIPIGVLWNSQVLRLVYAPRGESSGYLDFPLEAMREVSGRNILGALQMLLGRERLFDVPTDRRLPALLKESRKYQNEVSTRLADQVLDALWELLRGFQVANESTGEKILGQLAQDDPQHIYGGLITVLMRMVFLLYAEDRGLMPQDSVYEQNYAVKGLFERLREDAANHPDTMDQRYGAWAWLLSLFRLVYEGGKHAGLSLPARRGELFDPNSYPFLEGRVQESQYIPGQQITTPRVPDGTVYAILSKLLILEGERLSYRTLDVEQIGSVYESIMGYAVEQAKGPSIAVSPKSVVIDLELLLAEKPGERAKYLKDQAECNLTGNAQNFLKLAKTTEDVVAALGKKISSRTPTILALGSLYLQPGQERRRSGSHYTPRSLTEPIVRTALRPIFENFSYNPTPEQILGLKICDPAMGSGAFLVEACRQLAEHLVEAWQRHEVQIQLPLDEDILLYARRMVAQRCLYGVDKNPFAVNLAKLSLWLVTLAKDHAFTFVNHNLRHGDSLVGLSKAQIECCTFYPQTNDFSPLFSLDNNQLDVYEIRQNAIDSGDELDEEKEAIDRLLDEHRNQLQLRGDIAIGVFFSESSSKSRSEKLKNIRNEFERKLRYPDYLFFPEQIQQSLNERGIHPFHWEIEFPEVFNRVNPGFDCFVSNPPFAGKNTTINSHAEGYLDWLKMIHPESHGNADLVAHFFRRAFDLLRKGGTLGLIATNTIAQGDTRSSGLRWLCTHNGTIYNAVKRHKWPGLAAVVVSVIHVSKCQYLGLKLLNGKPTSEITAFLFHAGGNENPATLTENANKSFIGSYVLGMGFTFDDDNPEATPIAEMQRLIHENPRNQERIFPYIGGEEVNTSPTHAHHRYVINFGQMTEEEAWQWPDLMSIVEEKVRPARLAQNREIRARYWWRFGETTPALFKAIQELELVMVTCLVSEYLTFAFLPTKMVYSHKLAIFPLQKLTSFAILQSRTHEIFARFFSSTLGDGLNYSPSDCFETFPLPTGWEDDEELESIGKEYYEFRAALMVRNNEGTTKTYNRFHDPDENDPEIQKLRQLHSKMDRAVLDSYGWADISTDCEFLLDYEDQEPDEVSTGRQRKKPWRYRWPDEVRDEVLARLLELNSQRAEEEFIENIALQPMRKAGATKRSRKQELTEPSLPLDLQLSLK
jgi:type I restriction-modification system DNA methylase subunit